MPVQGKKNIVDWSEVAESDSCASKDLGCYTSLNVGYEQQLVDSQVANNNKSGNHLNDTSCCFDIGNLK